MIHIVVTGAMTPCVLVASLVDAGLDGFCMSTYIGKRRGTIICMYYNTTCLLFIFDYDTCYRINRY